MRKSLLFLGWVFLTMGILAGCNTSSQEGTGQKNKNSDEGPGSNNTEMKVPTNGAEGGDFDHQSVQGEPVEPDFRGQVPFDKIPEKVEVPFMGIPSYVPPGFHRKTPMLTTFKKGKEYFIQYLVNRENSNEHIMYKQLNKSASLSNYDKVIEIKGQEIQYNKNVRDGEQVFFAFAWTKNGVGNYIIAIGGEKLKEEDLFKFIRSIDYK